MEYCPKVPIPRDPNSENDGFKAGPSLSEKVVHSYDASPVFYCFCKFSIISSQILLVVRDTQGSKTPPPLAFALAKYSELLELMDSLPETMKREAGPDSASVLEFQ